MLLRYGSRIDWQPGNGTGGCLAFLLLAFTCLLLFYGEYREL